MVSDDIVHIYICRQYTYRLWEIETHLFMKTATLSCQDVEFTVTLNCILFLLLLSIFPLGALSDVLKDPLVHQLWSHSRKTRWLNTEQKLAISRALQNSFYLIQGPPGMYTLCMYILNN